MKILRGYHDQLLKKDSGRFERFLIDTEIEQINGLVILHEIKVLKGPIQRCIRCRKSPPYKKGQPKENAGGKRPPLLYHIGIMAFSSLEFKTAGVRASSLSLSQADYDPEGVFLRHAVDVSSARRNIRGPADIGFVGDIRLRASGSGQGFALLRGRTAPFETE